MRRITLIYDGGEYTYRWLKTMMWAKKEFKEKGYHVEYNSVWDYFPNKYNRKLKKLRIKIALSKTYDIVFLAFHHSGNGNILNEVERIDFIRKLRSRSQCICWLDTADSTGSCQFEVMPFVDLYFKKQILRDRSRYLQPMYMNRIYADYYHKEFHVSDVNSESENYIKRKEYLDKMRISWNVAFYDYLRGKNTFRFHPFKIQQPDYSNLDYGLRNIDVHYGGANPKVYGAVIGYQRSKMLELVMNLQHTTHPDVYKKIPRDEYLEELKHSKAIASPFGWGECCLRDFEAFVNCATLIKPSMEHCETYPSFYQEGVTYIPVKWDFSNFDDVVKNIGSANYKMIAKNGTNFFKKYRSDNIAKKLFAEHIIEELTK